MDEKRILEQLLASAQEIPVPEEYLISLADA